MADFICHGALAAGALAGGARWGHLPKWEKSVLAVYGFIMGTAPDTIDWIAAQFGWAERWQLYSIFHAHTLPHWGFTAPWYLLWNPPFFLHVFIDTWFHDPAKPGLDWWGSLGWLEITMWFVAALLLWYAYGFKGDEE